MRTEFDDVIHAVLSRDLHRSIRAAVIDDQPFDFIDSWDLPRQSLKCDREGPLLVVAGHLNDQLFHRCDAE